MRALVTLLGVALLLSPTLAAEQAAPPEVRIVTPRRDAPLSDPIVVQALVRSPAGRAIASVEAFVDDRPLGALDRPPYRWTVARPEGPLVELRVVAVDAAGARGIAELTASPSTAERFGADVEAVALSVAVTDPQGRFVSDLRADELVVRDDGVEQRILEFARAEAPLRVAILVDSSRSMAARMDRTRRALQGFLELLGADDQVKLMGFSDRVTSYTPFTDVHELVADFALGIRAAGGTALHDALLYGIRQLQPYRGARERRVVLLLTDGEDSTSRNPLHPALDLLRRQSVTVFALGQGEALDSDELRGVLREVTAATGGTAIFEDDPDRLPAALAELAATMRALYFVSYVPTHPRPGWHDVEVEARRPGLEVLHRPGYERAVREQP